MSIHYSYIDAPNLFIQHQNGKRYVYRELGEKKGIPIILLTHLLANLDNWDPRMICERYLQSQIQRESPQFHSVI